jgi:hypothetical protein
VDDTIKNLCEAKTEPSTSRRRVPGCGKGQIWIADDFDAPLPDDILATLQEPIEPVSPRGLER